MTVAWKSYLKDSTVDLSNSDLTCEGNANPSYCVGTDDVPGGGTKLYWEIYIDVGGGHAAGIGTVSTNPGAILGAGYKDSAYQSDGQKIQNNNPVAFGATSTTGDIIGIAYDSAADKIWFAKNNVWQASGDPANGTNPAYDNVTYTFYPWHNPKVNGAKATLRATSISQTYSPPSGFSSYEADPPPTKLLDGKLKIKNNATDLLDGKAIIDVFATNLLDGKAKVKDSTTDLFSGKAEVIGWLADLLDGKAEVTGWAADLLDGKANVATLATGLFNGKILVYKTKTSLLDGKAKIQGEAINLLDGKADIEFGLVTNLLDGKAAVQAPGQKLLDGKLEVRPFPKADVELPFPKVEAFTGGVANLEFPFLNLEAGASVGKVATANVELTSLAVEALAGARGIATLSSLECKSSALVGILASGDITIPLSRVSALALMDIVANLDVSLPKLRMSVDAISGIVISGDIKLYPLHLIAEGYAGPLAIGDIELPFLKVEGELAHVPTGSGDMEFPPLSLLARSITLVDSSDGCRILKYNRWR